MEIGTELTAAPVGVDIEVDADDFTSECLVDELPVFLREALCVALVFLVVVWTSAEETLEGDV